MRKPTFRRLGLGLLQQLTAMLIMLLVAGIIINSYVAVKSMDGIKTYYLDPLDTEEIFEDTEVFRDIFSTSVSDIIRLVAIKGQLETDGEFDPEKKIDVTRFVNSMGKESDCPATVVYPLETLIKWGRNGVEYSKRPMSMTEFVNYFGPATSVENFALDESGQLYFAGFLDSAFVADAGIAKGVPADMREQSGEHSAVAAMMQKYTEEQLEDMALSYIMTEASAEISMSREDDGSLTVYFPMLNCRYETADGIRQLVSYAANWVDYSKLQENVADTVTSLTAAYEQYLSGNQLYQEGRGNLKYAIRITDEEDNVSTYTNVSKLQNEGENVITDYFAECTQYLIYYLDSLGFKGNVSMDEEEIYNYLKEYEYVYTNNTHVWLGIDISYSTEGDAFYYANEVFQHIVPNIGMIVSACGFLGMIWLGLGIYLTVTAGVALDENDEKVRYLSGFDGIWTELTVVAFAGVVAVGVMGARYLMDIANKVYLSNAELYGESIMGLDEYGPFAVYGFLTSMFFNIFWYSFVRRIKLNSLWRGSFCYWVFDKCRRCVSFIFSHKNTAISMLIPYNLFILINLVGIVVAYIQHFRGALGLLPVVALAVMDSLVGFAIFRNRVERIEIVEGIKRIRDGEADYKLEVENLHGDNREMADAVNNIGEGIDNAVKTSMKDEQMKTDLITNVSHDIKTPLTSIVNYVDLLKRLKIKEEPAKSYISILDSKAQRLKQLTDDLVEASKISSGNIELKRECLNLSELLNQSIGEFSEKLEERKLNIVFNRGDSPGIIYADSRRMWRIIENLFNNICKYAMEGTRVYLELLVENGVVEMSIKNISEAQMNIKADDLTERFIRGDSSRTTEGSGLGLFIAKSLTVAQGGEFEIQLDGDLFKVLLHFPEYVEAAVQNEIEAEKAENETEATV